MSSSSELNNIGSGQHVAALHGLRGLMAWWVVLGHVAVTVGLHIPLIENNVLAVDVFVILSGFVITGLILKDHETYAGYITRRAFRLFPAYLIVLIVSTALLPIYGEAMSDTVFQTARNAARAAQIDATLTQLPAHLAVSLPLAQGLVPDKWLPGAAFGIIGQAWSISLEWQFYLVAPLALFAIKRPPYWIPLGLAVVVLLLLGQGLTDAYLGNKVFVFGTGMASYFGFAGRGKVRTAAFIIAGLTALAVIFADGPKMLIPLGIWAGCLTAVMARHQWGPARMANDILSSRPFSVLGDRSYAAYLVHMIPLYLGSYLLNGVEISSGAYRAGLFLIVIGSTLVLSEASYRLVEKPGIRLGANIARHLRSSPLVDNGTTSSDSAARSDHDRTR